ncbi:uncharacterized protein F4822DRAFT_398181 [Hypoxylon trugodes]|uniref:uncharacterized protein n=1 Tax=Hypoxylon trugodes TaxID=326681 RepID=UPI002192359A|nr:uncharacterized protein F4822DRAFT_398181 [Hypoxylon trugodes]KAI1389404.1 hypothetical protein F4822DRAFT_398181 [Hypoxylon trugodes]
MPGQQQPTERPASPPRRQRACAPCTKAKARCHFEDNRADNGCDRCRRMNISCTPQTTKSLRRPRQVKPATVVVPENSVPEDQPTFRQPNYGHVLLGAGPYGMVHNASDESTRSSPTSPVAAEGPQSNLTTIFIKDGVRHSLRRGDPFLLNEARSPPPVRRPQQPGFGITWNQAEQAVSDFKTKYTPFFPFVILGADISAQDLLTQKPLLFRAILLTAAQLTLAKQREIKKSILAYIGQHLLVLEKRDLGLLQGLLVFIAWGGHDFFFDQKITYLTYLTMGYAHNLAITRPPPTMQQKMMVAVNPKDAREALIGHELTTVLEESHTPEEQRAFLGCQYLLSVNSAQFGRDGVLKGEYVNRCLNSLIRPTDFNADFDRDFNLEKMIRFQQIVEQISERWPSPSMTTDGAPKVFTTAMSDEMQLIRNRLDQLFTNMAREHRQFVMFWSLHNYILVRLYLPASNHSRPTDEIAAQHQRQCMLYCLQAARSFLAAYLSMSPEAFLSRTFTSFSEALFVLVATSRLLLVDIEGWDLDEARRLLDFPTTLENLAATLRSAITLRNQKATEAAAIYGTSLTPDTSEDEKNDRFYTYSTKVEWIKNWFETQLQGGPGNLGYPVEQPAMGGSSYWAPENQGWNPFVFGLLGDENWNIEF